MAGEAINMNIESRGYPRTVSCDGETIEITLMSPDDSGALSTFIGALPVHDLLFLRRDIRQPKVLTAWMDAIKRGAITSLVARVGTAMVGCSAIVVDEMSWSRHVGELRVLVTPSWRGRGLGRVLIQESFAIALGRGLEKLTVQMTVDQRAAIALFEELGFRAEAILGDQVKDCEGKAHDLALLSHNVASVHSTKQAYGVIDAVGNRD
jgi:GNAT superfamily N-acetyltransferase